MPNEAPPKTVVMWEKETGNRAVVNESDVKDWKELGYTTREPKVKTAEPKPEAAPESPAGAQ